MSYLVLAELLLTISVVHATPKSRVLVYRHGSVGFELKLTPSELTVIDLVGVRTIPRAKCNARVLATYWGDLEKHIARLKPSSEIRQLAATKSVLDRSATLEVDSKRHQLGMFDPNLRYFDRLAKSTTEFFIAERRSCRGRK